MASFNKVILMGNITRDPEMRQAGASQVCTLGLAINESYVKDGTKIDKPVFVDVDCWGKTAENVVKFMRKGSPVLVDGRLQQDKWEKDGVKHTKIKVTAQSVKFLGTKPAAAQAQDGQPEPSTEQDGSEEAPF